MFLAESLKHITQYRKQVGQKFNIPSGILQDQKRPLSVFKSPNKNLLSSSVVSTVFCIEGYFKKLL